MANVLKMANIQAILSLHAAGWKQNRIAAELNLDRETVRKYLRQHGCGPKPANAPTGPDDPKPAEITGPPGSQPKPAENAPTGSTTQGHAPEQAAATVAPPTADVPRGPASQCEPYRETIQLKLDAGLSIKRIHQDLADEGTAVHYDALRRYARRSNHVRPLPFRRMECQPGEEAQADFGSGAPVIGVDGKRRKTHVFRIVLSYSRKGYSEVTFRQTTDDFLRALENAFRSFGGVPRTLVIDNLKAAVAHPDWFDPELTPKMQSFCQHYGTIILPTRPYTPRHKGKVESGVKYVKNNPLKGRKFESLSAEQEFLQHWEETIADTRIHGTTKQHRQDSRSSMSEGFERHERRDAGVVAAQQKNLTPRLSATPGSTQSAVDLRPPGSGYPSSGCSSVPARRDFAGQACLGALSQARLVDHRRHGDEGASASRR